MFSNTKNNLFVVLLLVLGIAVGVTGAIVTDSAAMAIAAPTATPAPRPEPPQIETWGIPDPAGGKPAECADVANCGLMCFYISEDAAANQHELSCIAWIFE